MTDIITEWQNAPLGKAISSRIRAWWHSLDTPNPWPKELTEAVHSIDALPVCHRCFRPFEFHSGTYFCADCGASIGPFNNCMPLLRYYAMGEVARSAVGPEAVLSYHCLAGYVFFIFVHGSWFLPFFIFRLCRNIGRRTTLVAEDTIDRSSSGPRIAFVLCVTAVLVLSFVSIFIPRRAGDFHYSPGYPREESSRDAAPVAEDNEDFLQFRSEVSGRGRETESNAFYSFHINTDAAPQKEISLPPTYPAEIPKRKPASAGNQFTYQELQDAEVITPWTQSTTEVDAVETIYINLP